MHQPLAYLNGQLIPGDQALLPVFDAGIVQGATVSETLRTFAQRLFRLDEHLQRLARSLDSVGFDIEISLDDLAGTCRDLVAHNTVGLEAEADLGLVLFVTAGAYATYAGEVARHGPARPTVCIHTFPLPFELWDDMQSQGLHLVIPSVRQLPASCVDPAIKHRSRLHYYLADREARRDDENARALLLDEQGRITETVAASFLIVVGTQVISPVAERVLPGISLQVLRELCDDLGLEFEQQELQAADLDRADEALVASTPYCLAPVTRINGQAVGDGEPGPIADRLLTAWDTLVGLDIRKQIRQGAQLRRASLATLPEHC